MRFADDILELLIVGRNQVKDVATLFTQIQPPLITTVTISRVLSRLRVLQLSLDLKMEETESSETSSANVINKPCEKPKKKRYSDQCES